MAITKVMHMKASGKARMDIHLKHAVNYILQPKKLGDANLAGGIGQRVCDCDCENDVRRSGAEFYEPGAGGKVLPAGVLCRDHDQLYL